MSTNTTRVAVYGTLKAGFHNHRIIEGAPLIGEGVATGTMHSMGGFPAVCEVGDNQIRVEVYDLDDEQLARCDRLEGHPNWYERKIVHTSVGPAWMYLMHAADLQDRPIVKSGNWER